MKVDRELVNPTEVVLTIQMSSEDEEPYLARSYRRVVGRLQIPGFRKGKAPRSIVESYVGRPGLLQEAVDFMVPETLDKVLKEQELRAFTEPDIELLTLEPFEFKAKVALEPAVELGDYQSIRVAREETEITEERIAEVIEQLRRQNAPWEPAERPAQEEDLATIDVHGEIDGEELVNEQAAEYVIRKEYPLPFPGFAEQLVGLTEGAEKEFGVTVPEDHPTEKWRGKVCNFKVKTLAVKALALPAADDEFAKGVGEGFENLAALRDNVRSRLVEQAKNAAQQTLEAQSVEALKKLAAITASPMIYERELEGMLEERERALRNQRITLENYLQFIQKTPEEFREEMRPRAEERMKTFLALRKFGEAESIEVADAEVQAEIDKLVESSEGGNQQQIRRYFSAASARDSVRSTVLNRKIMQRLVEIATQPGEPPAEASAVPAETTPAAESNEEGA